MVSSISFPRALACGGAACAVLALVAARPGPTVGTPGSGHDWTAKLTSTAPSKVSGSVTVAPEKTGTGMLATIALANAAPGQTYSWDVKTGQCGTAGRVVDAKSVYPAIKVSTSRSGREDATLKTALTSGDKYHVDLIPAGVTKPVACGDLEPAST